MQTTTINPADMGTTGLADFYANESKHPRDELGEFAPDGASRKSASKKPRTHDEAVSIIKSGKKLSYHEAVDANLKQMGTRPVDWKASPIKGMIEIPSGTGGVATVPEIERPAEYSPAPTLFKSDSDNPCCELCGATIKNVYSLQNDEKKWLLNVGSECVTHFGEGESGSRIAKKTQWEANRQLLRDAESIRKKMAQIYGDNPAAHPIIHGLLKSIGDKVADENPLRKHETPATDATLSGWETRKGNDVRDLMKRANDMLASPSGKEKQRQFHQIEISKMESRIRNGTTDRYNPSIRHYPDEQQTAYLEKLIARHREELEKLK